MFHVYFDACSINRITDSRDQNRVRQEAEAVLEIMRLISVGLARWTAGAALATELYRNPNLFKLEEAIRWIDRAGPIIPLSPSSEQRGRALVQLGYGLFDAFHLASAEEAAVDALLTTDDRFQRRAARGIGDPAVPVINPVNWLEEVQPWLPSRN